MRNTTAAGTENSTLEEHTLTPHHCAGLTVYFAACLLQLLGLERDAVRALVLRQPSLLARTTEGLAGKVDAYAEMFGSDNVGKVRTSVAGGGWRVVMQRELHRSCREALCVR
jgi:hypothetical protein